MTEGEASPDPARTGLTADLPTDRIDPRTTVGAVHLTVRDLTRSTHFYRESLGLVLLSEGEGRAALGVRTGQGPCELVVVHGNPDGTPGRGHSGLYHLALRLPERRDLAAWLAHAVRQRVTMTGFGEHFVSEAIYLADPDGHGIEIYHDRPRSLWEGRVAEKMTTLPLDVDGLFGELADPETEPFDGLPAGTVMGHVHLQVAAIPGSVTFYRDLLGFDLMAGLGDHAAFLAAGGYHHHIGINTWESAGVGTAPEGAIALRHATILLPDMAARHTVLGRLQAAGIQAEETAAGPIVRDPSGNRLLLALA